MKKLTLVLIFIIFALLLLASWLIYGWTRDISKDAMENAFFSATMEDAGGVDCNSAFKLSFDEAISSAAVNKALTVSPEIDFGVHQGKSKQEVLITPGLPLEQGSVYTFTLSGEDQSYSWAVQTKSPVSLTALRPGDQQLAVPLDSPVELVLSTTLQVDLDLLAEYLHISPQVEGSFEQSGRVLRFTPQEEWEPATVYRLSLKEGLPFEDSSLLLEESYTWSFETQRSSDTWTLSAASSFLPDENPLFRVKGLSCPAGQGKVTVLASLYKFADTLSYAESLSRVAEQYPVWSESFRCLGGTAVDQCQLLFSSALALEGSADGKEQLLELDSLPEGCYMLRLMQGSSVRDAFFMVSPLSVYSLRDHDQALFWSFDESRDGQPLRAAVADLWGGDRNVADADGLSMLTVGEQALISVSDENRELIFPLWTTVEEPVYPNVWRYLSSDKKVYSNGDTIHFYGMLATRDGSKLDYERVSVYILPQGAGLEDAIYRGYAELEEGVFSGSLALPQLLPGAYSLQVWQSGLLYIESSFLVNSDSNYLLPSPGLSEEQTAVPLELGAEYRVPGPEQGTSRLYVQASGGLLSAEAGHRGDFSLSFQPENQLEHYLLVLEHSEKGFSQLEYSRLYRAAEEKRLFLKAPEKQALVYGKANQLELQLCDQAGQPQPNVHLSLQVLSSDMRPEVDTFGSIYGDYQGSGLSLDTPRPTQSSYAASETLAYEVVETDENGRASLHFTMPSEKQKDCYLIAQAILCEGTEVSAGSLLLELQLPEILPAQEEEILPQTKTYGYSIKTLQAGMRLDADSRLVICGDAERLQLLDLLLAPAFDSSEQKGIEMLFSQAYAQQLLVDYGGDHMALLFDPQPFSVVNYQKADGGLGEESASSDPVLSAKLAAMTPSGISYYALSHYFEELLDQGPSLNEQAVALAGMASCGRANIREVKALLQNKELDDSAYCWLLWALIRNGDRATAAQLYESRIFTEMQEGDSLAWRAVLAAALGHGKEALLLLEEAEALEDELMAEQLLIARSLLPRSRQPERSFSYSVGEEIYEATVSGINDYFLSPLALNGEIRFTKAEEGLAFCNIFWHDPSAAEKP